MLLILTCSADKTVDLFETRHLKEANLPWVRLNTDRYPDDVHLDLTPAGFQIQIGNRIIQGGDVQAVWFRKPLPWHMLRSDQGNVQERYIVGETESALTAMYHQLSCACWVNSPDKNTAASEKMRQLFLATRMGFQIPQTLLSTSFSSVKRFVADHGGQCIAKPLRVGTIVQDDGSRKAFFSTKLSLDDLDQYADSIPVCPLIYQELVEKAFELRVTCAGDKWFAARLDSQEVELAQVDWRRSPYDIRYSTFDLPEVIGKQCIKMMHDAGLLYTAFDFIVTPRGDYVFLEHNPKGQFAWMEEKLDLPISGALLELFQNAHKKG